MNFSEWRSTTLGRITRIKGGKRLPKGILLTTEKNNHPYIRIKNLGSSKNINLNSDFEFVDDETFSKISRYIVNHDDVILSIVGTIGLVGKIGKTLDNASLTENCIKFVNLEDIDKDFLYYFLVSKYGQDEIKKMTVGAVQPKLPIKNIEKIEIKLPLIDEQLRISSILNSLEDKIELNNRINKTLEEMAQAIFKSWFIDFEPFKDEEFVESELGSIPKGWRIDSLTSLAEFLNGLAMQKYRPNSAKWLPVIKIRELNQGFADESCDKASVDIPGKYIIDDGDIIFSWSGTLLLKLWVGGIGGLNQHLFRVTPYDFPKWFVFFWIQNHMPFFKLISSSKATTMGHINRNHLEESKVTIPSKELITKADLVIGPIFEQIINLSIENKKLIDLRDSLLPKLLSGEIRVPLEEMSHAEVR